MAWRKPLPAPPEPSARLRCFDAADWPDPADWDDDAAVIEKSMAGWIACADKPGMWRGGLTAQWRAERRWEAALQVLKDEGLARGVQGWGTIVTPEDQRPG
jgi:hypothetical protein